MWVTDGKFGAEDFVGQRMIARMSSLEKSDHFAWYIYCPIVPGRSFEASTSGFRCHIV